MEQNQNGSIISIEQAVVGECYELILTNFSGLYRYAMGDVVLMKEMVGEYPLVQFLYRIGYMLNAAGEKVTTEQLSKSICKVMRQTEIVVIDYRAAIDSDSERYQIVMAVESKSGSVADRNLDTELISRQLDKTLIAQNPDYGYLREENYL